MASSINFLGLEFRESYRVGRLAACMVALLTTAMWAAAGEGKDRILEKEVTVSASLDEVWRAWTTSEGIAEFFSPESRIELRVGGPYELYMSIKEPDESGKRGSEGCKVLSYLPKEMLSFEWNFSPKTPGLRMSGAKTHVVLRFEDLGGRVRVRFAQLGWREGEEWDQGFAYFDSAWDWVLANLKKSFDDKHGTSGGDSVGVEASKELAGD